VSDAAPTTTPELVASAGAPLGSADATRRWALRFGDGRERFPGVTRLEGWAASVELGAMGAQRSERALVEIALPVVLSDGAGPYLIDAAGRLVLALAPHPRMAGVSVAMGEAAPAHAVGLVERRGDGPVWRWIARADVPPAGRVEALDGLDAAGDRDEGLTNIPSATQEGSNLTDLSDKFLSEEEVSITNSSSPLNNSQISFAQ
jgi:hypothetical protein